MLSKAISNSRETLDNFKAEMNRLVNHGSFNERIDLSSSASKKESKNLNKTQTSKI